VAVLDVLIGARRWDVYSDAFEDAGHFDRYLEETSGGLMWLAAKACGAPDRVEPAARAFGWASGLANFLRAVPELEARGRIPLVDGRAEAVRGLAAKGLAKIAAARRERRALGPAMLAGWQAEALLRQVVAKPLVVAEGAMGVSEFERRGRLAWAAVSGRW
jgi:15-cis-phytoene synthase